MLRVLAFLLFFTACAPEPDLMVGTAASLAPVVEPFARGFGVEHGIRVSVSVGSSLALQRQVEAGAPLHLFLSAHPRHITALDPARRRDPVLLARNRIRLALPPDSAPRENADVLASAGRIGMAQPGVPAGDLAAAAMELAAFASGGNTVHFPHERAVVEALRQRAIDAGWVYASSVASMGLVDTDGGGPWPSTTVAGAVLRPAPDLAARFLADLAASPRWRDAGFEPAEDR